MIKAVLLDMDNTLLGNPDARFAAAFRELFDNFFREEYGVEGSVAALRDGIGNIGRPRQPIPTNFEAMLDCLELALPLSREEIGAALARFYGEIYPKLQPLIEPEAGAGDLIAQLLQQGLLVALATNPLYPESAILQRLDWAGLGGWIDEFAFITHSENMHYAKPQPEYHAETIARVGVEPDEALMVGDSAVNDIQPAHCLGSAAWHLASDGDLSDLQLRAAEPGWRESYQPLPLRPTMIAPQYRGNLAALTGLLAESSPAQWHERPDPDEWSIMQIVCHLWATETAVHQARLRLILSEEDPFLAALPPPGPHVPPCHDDAEEVLSRFIDDRRATLRLLSALPPIAWLRKARHSIFGLTTLLEMAQFTAQHDRLHITQLCQTLGKCADDAALS